MMSATNAKKTPDTCSQTTLENRTTGVTSEFFAWRPAALTVATSGMRRALTCGLASTVLCAGTLGRVPLFDGFGELAASAACASVFAAWRAP